YDWDAATVLGAALPTDWSAEDTDRDGPERLDVAALEAAGRAEIGAQVEAATRRGIDATAWLPSSNGADALLEYAERQGASVIVIPAELHAKGGLERITEGATDPSDTVRDKAAAEVVVVPAPTR
ncbi:MAG: universal stress protein, partial [Chloroflexi bacterium]|nr:universal stress protein [Chloroflexota bacterium]